MRAASGVVDDGNRGATSAESRRRECYAELAVCAWSDSDSAGVVLQHKVRGICSGNGNTSKTERGDADVRELD